MLKNLNITNGLIFSQRVMLELTKHGFSREKAYSIVQKNAQNSHKKNISFYQSLMNDSLINKKISNKDLKKMFDLNYHTKKINIIFNRVFNKNMNKGKKLYEGKAKILYEGPEKGTAIQHFKDDATAFNNQKKTIVEGKGVLNNRISEHIFNNLNQIGIKTHLIKRLNMREQLVRLVTIISC